MRSMIISILFIATLLGRTTHGMGHLRSSNIESDPSNDEQYHGLQAVNELHHDGNDHDSLMEWNKDATPYEPPAGDGVHHYAVHLKEAIESDDESVEEFIDESMTEPVIASAVKSVSEPHYAMHLKEPIESVDESTEEIIDESVVESDVESADESSSETSTFDNDFEIKIVGGDPSDPNEFPYFGT